MLCIWGRPNIQSHRLGLKILLALGISARHQLGLPIEEYPTKLFLPDFDVLLSPIFSHQSDDDEASAAHVEHPSSKPPPYHM
ncbi:hypothetical protein C0989_005382 [Termitomyces sp. Mn162]|nr:hypothetical protein C0989_005382 [Termitomyces sp. Mn162]